MSKQYQIKLNIFEQISRQVERYVYPHLHSSYTFWKWFTDSLCYKFCNGMGEWSCFLTYNATSFKPTTILIFFIKRKDAFGRLVMMPGWQIGSENHLIMERLIVINICNMTMFFSRQPTITKPPKNLFASIEKKNLNIATYAYHSLAWNIYTETQDLLTIFFTASTVQLFTVILQFFFSEFSYKWTHLI